MGLNWCIEMVRSYPEILLFMSIFISLRLIFRVKQNIILPINWPVFGMLPHLLLHLHRMHDYVLELLSASGMTFMFKGPWFTGANMLITCDPDNVNYVFNTNEKLYPKGADSSLEIRAAFGESITTSEGEKWKWHRRALHRILGNRKFQEQELQATSTKIEKCMIPILERCGEENKEIDLQDMFLRIMFDTSCTSYLGVDPTSLNYDFPAIPFVKALEMLEESIFSRHLFPKIITKLLKILNVGYMKKLLIAIKVTEQFVTQKIEEKITLIQKEESTKEREINTPADLLALSDQSSSVELAELRKALISNAKVILFAAIDTTATSLAWFFWLLSKHPDVEKKIINELKKIWPRLESSRQNKNIAFDRDDLQKLVYLHGAICECLRLYPPAPFERKNVSQTDVLPSGHRVKPGTCLIFHTYSMGRMESVWGKDCTEFKPERWINENGEIRHEPSFKFFSFNSGPRTCLGKDMAFNKMKMIIGTMLCNFHVEMVPGHVVEPKLGVILYMKNGFVVRVRKRERV